MASISHDKTTGTRRLQFTTPDKRRRAIRLGKVSKKQAEDIRRHVDDIVAARVAGTSLSMATAQWVADLPDVLHERLAKAQLIEARGEGRSATLGEWCDKYIAQRTDLAEGSIEKLNWTINAMKKHFGEKTLMVAITKGEAADWRAELAQSGIAEGTVRGHIRNAKTIFNEALERDMISANPFKKLKSSSVAANRDRVISSEEADRILEACPNHEWRLYFGLMRYAGMRAPSETHILTWDCIDWERRRMSVYAPKTKQTRIVPIDARLYPLLGEAFEKAKARQKRVLTLSRNNLHRDFKLVLRRASIAPWEDLFQTLRRSCESEWAKKHPQHAVSEWTGHSMAVSEKHYLTVTDDLFDAASAPLKTGAPGGAKSGAPYAGNGLKWTASADLSQRGVPGQETRKPASCNGLRQNAGSCKVDGAGIEPATPGFSVHAK